MKTGIAGEAGVSGTLTIQTGNATLGNSGSLNLFTGSAAGGKSGATTLLSVGSGDAGMLLLTNF